MELEGLGALALIRTQDFQTPSCVGKIWSAELCMKPRGHGATGGCPGGAGNPQLAVEPLPEHTHFCLERVLKDELLAQGVSSILFSGSLVCL